jgi:hypothetical protein
MPDTKEALAYEAAASAVRDQRDRLGDLRSRGGTLLAAAAIVTSFLGAEALRDTRTAASGEQVPQRALEMWEYVGIGCFIGLAVMTTLILLPWRGWQTRLGAEKLVADYVDREDVDVARMQRNLALHLDAHHRQNKGKLAALFWLFRIAAVLLGVEVVAWMIDLAD